MTNTIPQQQRLTREAPDVVVMLQNVPKHKRKHVEQRIRIGELPTKIVGCRAKGYHLVAVTTDTVRCGKRIVHAVRIKSNAAQRQLLDTLKQRYGRPNKPECLNVQ